MIIIADTNILISASLQSNGNLYSILTSRFSTIDFVVPEFALTEIKRHKERICKDSKIHIKIFQANLETILEAIHILPDTEVNNSHILTAENLTKDVDIDDTIFIAFSLALDSMVWTGDLKLYKRLRKIGFKNIITTKELTQIIKGL